LHFLFFWRTFQKILFFLMFCCVNLHTLYKWTCWFWNNCYDVFFLEFLVAKSVIIVQKKSILKINQDPDPAF
jgi:hypothetical protein